MERSDQGGEDMEASRMNGAEDHARVWTLCESGAERSREMPWLSRRNRTGSLVALITRSALTVVVLLCVFQREAEASLRFCNQTDDELTLAIALQPSKADTVHVIGWWTLKYKECKTVSPIDLSTQYKVYYYAHSAGNSAVWTGYDVFCVRTEMFDRVEEMYELTGAHGQCPSQGFRHAKFRRLLFNVREKDFIENLTRPSMQAK